MEIINPWVLYLILQLDSIKAALVGPTLLAGCVAVGGIIISCVLYAAGRENCDDDMVRMSRAGLKYGIAACVLFGILVTVEGLLPSTKNAAAIAIIPAIANSTVVQEEAGELYGLAKEAMKNLAGTKPKENEDED